MEPLAQLKTLTVLLGNDSKQQDQSFSSTVKQKFQVVRISCSSFVQITVNWSHLGFGLLVKQHKTLEKVFFSFFWLFPAKIVKPVTLAKRQQQKQTEKQIELNGTLNLNLAFPFVCVALELLQLPP